MPKPKSIIQKIEVDEAKRSHNCQHNKNHRVECGNKRLKVWKDRSCEHFCVNCALEIINRDIAKLQEIAKQLKE